MKPAIEVEFRKVPRGILSDFEKSIDKSVSLKIYEDTNDHFEPPADIVIYINEHLTEILIGVASGFLTSALWDGIKLTWGKLIAFGSSKKKEDKARIELSFKVEQDKSVEFNLSADFDPKQVDTVVNKILDYLKEKDQQNKDFGNPAFREDDAPKPKIKMKWNPKIKNWEPENFDEYRKRKEELLRELFRRADS